MEIIEQYFQQLTSEQKERFAALLPLYSEWNQKINVISRKDMEHFYVHHVLHSLSIAKFTSFVPGTEILDLGTGGGFPGIPLAIMFPEVSFHLVDSIGKKITVVTEVANALGLSNVKAEKARVEDLKGRYDFVVSRAVANITELDRWIERKFKQEDRNPQSNGLICLKGGDLEEEFASFKKPYMMVNLDTYFHEPFFKQEKKLVYVPAF